MMISYKQTIHGTIKVDDIGQTTSLEAVSGGGQAFYPGQQFPQPLAVRAVRSDGELITGKPIVFSLKSAPPGGQATFNNPTPLTNTVGMAETFFTLSGPIGEYVLKAYCAECAQQKEVTFAEKTDGVELRRNRYELHGKIGDKDRKSVV